MVKEFEKIDESLDGKIDVLREERENFVKDLDREDIEMSILKSHLYVEKEMVKLVDIFFKNPKVLKSDKFAERLNLLYALGVIDKELYDPLKELNSIRNKIGHNLDYVYGESEYKGLYDTLSKDMLMEFKKDLKYKKIGDDMLKTVKGELVRDEKTEKIGYIEKTKILLGGLWISTKMNVLYSCIIKKSLANHYEQEALQELQDSEE